MSRVRVPSLALHAPGATELIAVALILSKTILEIQHLVYLRRTINMTSNSSIQAASVSAVTKSPYWRDVPDEKWMDWRWQMSNRLNTFEELDAVIRLTKAEEKALQTQGLFRVDVTPYFASLIDPDDPNCPVRKQVIPTAREMVPFQSMMEDSLSEDKHSPVPGLVHRYPDRVLMLVTTQCASYCRYCTRSRIVGDPTQTFSREEFDAQIEYIENTPQIRDVLLSGGDPMVLAPKLLNMILERLRAIPHVEILRIGSRVPVFLSKTRRAYGRIARTTEGGISRCIAPDSAFGRMSRLSSQSERGTTTSLETQ